MYPSNRLCSFASKRAVAGSENPGRSRRTSRRTSVSNRTRIIYTFGEGDRRRRPPTLLMSVAAHWILAGPAADTAILHGMVTARPVRAALDRPAVGASFRAANPHAANGRVVRAVV